MMEDGGPPPESLVIELVCNGVPRPQAYTDSKGRFSFQVGNTPSVMADASTATGAFDPSRGGSSDGSMSGMMSGRGGGISEQSLQTCDLRAALPGFRSENVSLSGRRVMDNPDIGTLILKRLGNVEGTTISGTSLNAPKDARKAYEKGRDAVRKKKWEDARPQLEKAVAAYPKYAVAWYELGIVHEQGQQPEEARKAYAQALAADARFVSPYLRLAAMAATERKWQDVADTTDRVIKMNPLDFPSAYLYNSLAYLNLQKLDVAEKSAREAVKLDAQHRIPKAHHLLGVILAQKQDFAGAGEQMKNYLKFAPNAGDTDVVKKQLAEVEKLQGVKVSAQQ
jgi:tetratricopeptide (TPR) repeat protein